jgi:multidrug efflux pump subunit AcrA (membrane-fusion protein)
MKRMSMVVVYVLLAAVGLVAQQALSIADLEASLDRAQTELRAAEGRVSETERAALRRDLDELRDEVTFHRVQRRRGERVSDKELADVSVRINRFIDDVKGRGRGRVNPDAREIPVGTEVDVRLQTPLNSRDAQVEDRVDATTMVNLYRGDTLLVPAGSVLSGYLTAVERATRTDRKGSLTIRFNRLTIDGRTVQVRAQVTQALESEGLKGEAGRIGAGAGVGAIIGGILGGFKGAVTGILVGGGGTVLATEGKDLELGAGAVLRVRFDSAVSLD